MVRASVDGAGSLPLAATDHNRRRVACGDRRVRAYPFVA
jgi:hypothetical protein